MFEKIITTPVAYDGTRQMYYKLIKLDDEKKTLLLTVWGENEKMCSNIATAVMDKLTNNG